MENIFKQGGELKKLLNSREINDFRSPACFSANALRRKTETRQENDYRQSFSIDADRILNSLAFTRYIDKTQVFSLIQNDHLTHRVLHVQLVSRVARTIGRYLGLNQDLIEAAALGHDIGHPPFGHDGEGFLSRLTKACGAGYFHHNLQSIQSLDKIERKGQGWNLSLQTLDAIACHNGEVHSRKLVPENSRSFKDFDLMIEQMKTKPACNVIPMTLEGCVVRMADTISYVGRDLEDGIRLGVVKREQVPEECAKTLGQTNGTIVFNLVTDLISNSIDQPFIRFSENAAHALLTLKQFNYKHIYKNPLIKKHLTTIEDIFKFLFEKFLEDLNTGNQDSVIFKEFLIDMDDTYPNAFSPPEIVRDFISGMTDSYFIRQAPESMRPRVIDHV